MFYITVYYIVCLPYMITHSRQHNADMPFGVQGFLVYRYMLRILDDIIRFIHTFSRARLQLQTQMARATSTYYFTHQMARATCTYYFTHQMARAACTYYFIHNLRCSVQLIKRGKRDEKIFENSQSGCRHIAPLAGYPKRLGTLYRCRMLYKDSELITTVERRLTVTSLVTSPHHYGHACSVPKLYSIVQRMGR